MSTLKYQPDSIFWPDLQMGCGNLTTWGVTRTRELRCRHNEHDGVSNHQRLDDLLNRSFRRTSRKTSKLRVTGFCEGNSPVTGEFPSQRASNAENVSIWWRHNEPSNGHYRRWPFRISSMERTYLAKYQWHAPMLWHYRYRHNTHYRYLLY